METIIPEPKFGALSSSVNPQELSLTVVSFIRLVTALLVTFGLVTAVGMDTVLEQIPVIVSAGYAAWQGLETIWGAIRKVIVAFSK